MAQQPARSDITAAAARSVQARRRIGDHVVETPLLTAAAIGETIGSQVLLKCENFQATGSFKARGAFSKLTALAGDTGAARYITASSGNHGIASSLAASRLSRSLCVVLPQNVSQAKLARIRGFGVDVVMHGAESGEAELHARQLAHERTMIYVSPYNDPDIVAGQGTIGLELLEQAGRIDNVFVAMGGGGLIGGIGASADDSSSTVGPVTCSSMRTTVPSSTLPGTSSIEVSMRG